MYIKVYNVRDTIFSDQTGQFPVSSKSGFKYIMIMVEIDSNSILVGPMKSHKDGKMTRAYQQLIDRLKRSGITRGGTDRIFYLAELFPAILSIFRPSVSAKNQRKPPLGYTLEHLSVCRWSVGLHISPYHLIAPT